MTPDGSSRFDESSQTDCLDKGCEPLAFVDGADGMLDSSPRRNLVQLLTVLAFVAVGAVIGSFMTPNRSDLAALVGAVLGMVLGTCLSGFVIMLLPPQRIRLTPNQVEQRFIACKRRLWIACGVATLMVISLPLVIGTFGHNDTDLAWVVCLGWPLATVVACVYAKGIAKRLKQWRCTQCGGSLETPFKLCAVCGRPLIHASKADGQIQ